MKQILFLHGFFASGQCQPALALREVFEGRAEVISPDLPTHPKEALALIRDVIDSERPVWLLLRATTLAFTTYKWLHKPLRS